MNNFLEKNSIKKTLEKSNENRHAHKYDIVPIETDKTKLPQKASSKQNITPMYPFSMVLSGRSGSGKTQLLLNMLTRKDLLGDFYHKIIIFSPTAGDLDDTYSTLKLPPENFIKKFDSSMLETILNNRKAEIKKDGIEKVGRHNRVILIFDDMIAERKFLESKENLMLFTLLRHYLISVVVLSQSFKKIPRSIRINSNFTCIFPSLESEIAIMIEEITPAGVSKKAFRKIIDYCTEGRYDFMTINNHAPPKERIRKNLYDIIDVSLFQKAN